jgi:hypothetical protein
MQRSGWERFKDLVQQIEKRGFALVDRASLPQGCERLLVLARSTKESPRMAQKPAAGQSEAASEKL